jgi:hypothetical protein
MAVQRDGTVQGPNLDTASSVRGEVVCTDPDPSKPVYGVVHYAVVSIHLAKRQKRQDIARYTSEEVDRMQVDKEVEATCFVNGQILYDVLHFYCPSAFLYLHSIKRRLTVGQRKYLSSISLSALAQQDV